MVINMLKAISKMIDCKGIDPIIEFKARVECAKTMLDEIIKGSEGKNSAEILSPISEKVVEPMGKPIPTKPHVPKDKRQIVVDASRKITSILNYPLDGKIELDGKIMTHAQALGKEFTNGRFVE